MNNSNKSIGIFDSGIGGLNITKQIIEKMPNENIIYLADTLHLPYGNKPRKLIEKYTKQIIKFFKSKNVKAIIVACNTAYSTSIKYLKKQKDIPIIGVPNIAIKKALSSTKNNNIGIIGTINTIRSKYYYTHIKKLNKNINVFSKSCDLLCPIIEKNKINNKNTYKIIENYLNPLIKKNIDSLIIGCTHYTSIYNIIKKITSKNKITIIDPASQIHILTKKILSEHKILSTNNKGTYEFYVTNNTNRFDKFISSILKINAKSKEVKL